MPALHQRSAALLNNSYLGRARPARPRSSGCSMSKKGPAAFTSADVVYGDGGWTRLGPGERIKAPPGMNFHAAVASFVAPGSLETVEFSGFSAFDRAAPSHRPCEAALNLAFQEDESEAPSCG